MNPREEVPMAAELLEDVTLSMPLLRDWTWDDLRRTPEDGRRWEIIDGSLDVSASPTLRHQLAASRLAAALLAAAPADVEVTGPVDVELDDSVLAPDVVVFPADAVDDHSPLAAGKILLAVEVVSPSSRRMDRTVKPSILAEHGVPAYWRVELDVPGAPAVVVHALADGEVVTVHAGETVTVDAPFVVELRPAELAGPRRRG
ncbi:MAG TPA: Uma2 family endonuclease [Mycobacteriales bacterium]